MKLYKYTDERGIDIINSLRVKVTQPIYLNDPFEFTPKPFGNLTFDQALNEMTDESIHKIAYKGLIEKGEFQGSYEDYKLKVMEKSEEIADNKVQDYPKMLQQFCEYFSAMISKDSGVFCLSAENSSKLMWSHYTNGHKGMLIEFDTEQYPFNSIDDLNEVIYQRQRPIINLLLPKDSTEFEKQIDNIIKTKSEDWSYEKEWRYFLHLKCYQKITLENGQVGYFLKISPNSISCIVLGNKCDEDCERDIRQTLSSNESFKHIVLKKAFLHQEKFDFKYEEI